MAARAGLCDFTSRLIWGTEEQSTLVVYPKNVLLILIVHVINVYFFFTGSLNTKMKEKRKEKAVISTVGDILLQRVGLFCREMIQFSIYSQNLQEVPPVSLYIDDIFIQI